jgi:hypothetical protein
VWISILAVASSTSTIFLGLSSEREILSNCFSPALKLSPLYVILVSSPSLSDKMFQRSVSFKALMICESVKIPIGSIFYINKSILL